MSDPSRLLIVDDEPNICSGLAKGLTKEAEVIDTASDAKEALSRFSTTEYPVVIVDVRLPGAMDGLDLVAELSRRCPSTTLIVITAHGTVETAVEAMRRGAFDFITKPVDLKLIREQVRRAFDHHRLRDENRDLRNRLAGAGEISGIIGNCSAIQTVLTQIRQVATTDATVLIHGESGTGKELVARALHDLSQRANGPFVPINLGALPETLLESELFGHEKGAFTGAHRQKPGCFEQAQNGTLFLDEVTEMSMRSQIDLLRVLENGTYQRVGGEKVIQTDSRIVSATNKDIQELTDEKVFRADLYYRLNVVPIEIPSLRQRREDIPLLAEHFIHVFCDRHRRPMKRLSQQAVELLVEAHWPGNIRQLKNVIERLVVTVAGEEIDRVHIPSELHLCNLTPGEATHTLSDVVETAEKQAIQETLAANGFHREQTAKVLGISIRTLHYKMSRYGLH